MPYPVDHTKKPSHASHTKKPRTSTNSSSSTSGGIAPFTFMPPVNLAQLHPGSTPPKYRGSSVPPTSAGITRGSSSQPRASKRTHPSSSSAPVGILPPIRYVTGSAAAREATFANTYPSLVKRTALAASSDLSVLSAAADHAKKVSVLGGSGHQPNMGCTGLGTVSIGHGSVKLFQRDTRLLRAVIDGDIGRVHQLIGAGVNLYEKYPDGTVLDYAINNTHEQHKKDDIISAIFLGGFNIFSHVVSPSILEEIARRAINNRLGFERARWNTEHTPLYMPMPFGYDHFGNKIFEMAARGEPSSQSTFARYPRLAMQCWLGAPIEVRDPQVRENMARIALVCQTRWRSQDAFKMEVIIQSHMRFMPQLLGSRQDAWPPLLMSNASSASHRGDSSSSFLSTSSNSSCSSQSFSGDSLPSDSSSSADIGELDVPRLR